MNFFCQVHWFSFHGGYNVVNIIVFLMTYAQSHKLLCIYNNNNNNNSNFQCKILGEWAEGAPCPRYAWSLPFGPNLFFKF